MPDINLIDDAKGTPGGDSGKKRKPPPPAPVELSSPLSFGDSERPLKKPSSFGLWLRSILSGGRSDKARKASLPPPPPPRTPKGNQPARNQTGSEPVDIFADLGAGAGGPSKPRLAQEPAAPTGPRPGDFPVLPSVPAWNAPAGGPAPTPTVPTNAPTAPLPPPAMTRSGPVNLPPRPAVPTRPSASGTPTPGIPPASGLRIPSLSQIKPTRVIASEDPAMNLLPEDLVISYDPKKKMTTVALVAVAAMLVIGIGYVSLLLWKETVTRQASEKSDQASVIEAQIKSKELQADRQAAVVLRESNRTLRKLLDTHVYWTRFLQYFEKYTLSTVTFPSGVSVDPSGTLTLTGSAPDLATIVAQLKVLEEAKDFVTVATINSISRDSKKNTYTFILDLTYKTDILLNPITPGSTLNNSGNSNTNTSPSS